MDRNPRSLTDSELAQRSRLRTWENTLREMGCLWVVFAILFAIIVCVVVDQGPLWLEIPIGIIVCPYIVLKAARAAAIARAHPFLAELQRRYGQLDFPSQVDDAIRGLDANPAASHVLLFQGRAVGHVAFIRVTIETTDHPRAAINLSLGKSIDPTLAVVLNSYDRSLGKVADDQRAFLSGRERARLTRRNAALAPNGIVTLLEEITALGELNEASIAERGGYQCCVAIIRKHPSTVKKGCCNLMYLTEEESNGSTMALIRRLLSLARPLSSSPLIVGWADFRGDTGQREFSSYVAEARKRLIEDSSPDWIVLVQGILDSQPSHYALIKILLHTKAGTRARLEAVTSRRATSRRTLPAQRIRQGAVDLETEETRELLQSLEQLGAVAIENIPSTISRGYPCSIAALRNDPPLELRGSCDLLGTAEADAEKPTAILIRRVMAIAERASSSPMIQGWREYAGDTNVWRSVAPFKLLSSENGRGQVLDADWTITLTLYSVPHGGKKYVRVDLRETEPPLGGMISTNQPFECDPEVPRPRSERTKRDLHVNEARSLLKRLQKLEPCALITIPSTVVDGAPCTVTVLRRSKPSRQTAECNLMGLRDGRPGTETSGLILELLRLANAEAQ